MIGTYGDDTGRLASHLNPLVASRELQYRLDVMDKCYTSGESRANEDNFDRVTIILNKSNCPPCCLYGRHLGIM